MQVSPSLSTPNPPSLPSSVALLQCAGLTLQGRMVLSSSACVSLYLELDFLQPSPLWVLFNSSLLLPFFLLPPLRLKIAPGCLLQCHRCRVAATLSSCAGAWPGKVELALAESQSLFLATSLLSAALLQVLLELELVEDHPVPTQQPMAEVGVGTWMIFKVPSKLFSRACRHL